jgi:hypothetical protein
MSREGRDHDLQSAFLAGMVKKFSKISWIFGKLCWSQLSLPSCYLHDIHLSTTTRGVDAVFDVDLDRKGTLEFGGAFFAILSPPLSHPLM